MITCEKSQVTRYLLRSRKPSPDYWWAEICISEDGSLNVLSDYGNYAYAWRSIGQDTFKQFLISLHNDYLMGKIGQGLKKEFNNSRTMKLLYQEVLERRREKDITEDEARECWDAINDVDDYKDDSEYCNSVMDKYSPILKLYNEDYSAIPCEMDDNSQLTAFVEKVWPEFIRILKEEQ